MIAGTHFTAHGVVYAAFDQSIWQRFAEKKMVEPQPVVLLVAFPPVGPERIHAIFAVKIPDGIVHPCAMAARYGHQATGKGWRTAQLR